MCPHPPATSPATPELPWSFSPARYRLPLGRPLQYATSCCFPLLLAGVIARETTPNKTQSADPKRIAAAARGSQSPQRGAAATTSPRSFDRRTFLRTPPAARRSMDSGTSPLQLRTSPPRRASSQTFSIPTFFTAPQSELLTAGKRTTYTHRRGPSCCQQLNSQCLARVQPTSALGHDLGRLQ